ncbi:MAG: PQQ-dependent sugar dehydrogenase, partial [Anaerolineales bacterium]|nr:PQQ-dependent sugar dehydrogenase [Anaerolineales bacterium]
MKNRILLTIVLVLLLLTGCGRVEDSLPTIEPLPTETPVLSEAEVAVSTPKPIRVETVQRRVTGLVVALAFAEDDRLFYAEKQGDLFVKNVDVPDSSPQQILQVNVAEGNENGLLGLALDPKFAENGYFYIYYNVPNENMEPIGSRIVRYTLAESTAVDETILIELPASPEQGFHFGGGLEVGPDGKLYLIFVDRNMPDAARDPAQLPGSVLRYNPDGTIPDDNPFPDSPVYAYGIRNGFGLTWHPTLGLLYETENGVGCDDELNLILPGANYGWGVHRYDDCPYPDDTGNPPIYQWE